MTHYGLTVGARVVEAAFGSTSQPAEVIHLYSTDKNRVRVRFDGGEEADFVAEFCRPVGPSR